MTRFKPSLSFVLVALLLAAVAIEIGWTLRVRARAIRSLMVLEAKEQERNRLARLSPAPRAENEVAIAAAVSEADHRLTRLRNEVGIPNRSEVEPVLSGPMDEYFSLGDFAEKSRSRMNDASIGVGPAERFGFAAYANTGPGPEILSAVRRQRETVHHLVETLVESQPVAFMGIKRAKPEGVDGAKESAVSDDHFGMPRHLSIVRAGLVDTDAFRMEFTGYTSGLRRFLNRLADGARPVVVRSVEVEPMTKRTGAHQAGKSGSATVVEPTVLKFTLVMEIPRAAGNGGVKP